MLAFDTNLAPIVGQQVTLTAATRQAVSPRIDLLIARADAGECDPRPRPAPPRHRDRRRADLHLCPAGIGHAHRHRSRLDGALDGDERAAGSDPADPRSTP